MLDMAPETIQIVIQGGAVGILLMFGAMGYRLAHLAINKGFEFVSNHLAHNTTAVEEGTAATKEMGADLKRLVEKLDK